MPAETIWQFVKLPDFPDGHVDYRAIMERILPVLRDARQPVGFNTIVEKTGYKASTVRGGLYVLQKYGAVKLVGRTGFLNLEELEQYSSVKNWLSALKPSETLRDPKYRLSKFIRYVRSFKCPLGTSPDELIENAMQGTKRQEIQHLQLIKDYVASLPEDNLPSSKEKDYRTIRSFYSHNQINLPKSPLRFDTDASDVELSVEMSPEEAFDMLDAMKKAIASTKSPRDRAIMIIKLQGFMDSSTLCKVWNQVAYYQLAQHFGTENSAKWDPDKAPVQINLIRPKTSTSKSAMKFYNFIHRDGIVALKDWLAVRRNMTGRNIEIHTGRNEKNIPLSDPIFITSKGTPINTQYIWQIFNQAGRRSGAITVADSPGLHRGGKNRYNFHSHEVRDLGITLARLYSNPIVGEFCSGHTIDRLRYDKSPWRDPAHFAGLMQPLWKYLNIVSSDPEKDAVKEELAKVKQDRDNLGVSMEARLIVQEKRHKEEMKKLREDLRAEVAKQFQQFQARYATPVKRDNGPALTP
ncbi:MAG TPA: hypothetical protein VFF30_02630 [Nitrososphaerales archaeon]|nr:hypothetical protein [Nitrososphaerales archaeon]